LLADKDPGHTPRHARYTLVTEAEKRLNGSLPNSSGSKKFAGTGFETLGPSRPLMAAHQSASLQPRKVEREHHREKRLEQTKEGMVIDMPRPGLRHRPQSAGIAEGEALGTGRDFITALRRAGNRVEPIERAPVPVAARDP
jgi:hypothetical protein